MDTQHLDELNTDLISIISETNGITLKDTLELLYQRYLNEKQTTKRNLITEFRVLLSKYREEKIDITEIFEHPIASSFFYFFKNFPLPFHEDHIHLTGSLDASFVYPRIKKLLEGPNKAIYEKRITDVYGQNAIPIKTEEDVKNLLTLKEGEAFTRYLQVLFLTKLVLIDKQSHFDAAYHMASTLYQNYNVGRIRLKFTLSRSSGISSEQIPGLENITEEDVVLGLFEGFMQYKKENPKFDFILSPSFRKEADFYDQEAYPNKQESINAQVDCILKLIEKHPELKKYLTEIDTVGDEKSLYRKKHFEQMKEGIRKLQYNGFKIRSHHGETWKTLANGIQSVDNAMNIWYIDTLEHGLSLGVNPNFYFHNIYQRAMNQNKKNQPLKAGNLDYNELEAMDWHGTDIFEKLKKGMRLNDKEINRFIKIKFHTAREIEHYQHDVLNRMLNKHVSVVSLPTSNKKLTQILPGFQAHPFSWWEKKGVELKLGTDNYITLNTNFIQEILVLLFSDASNLKITKILMIITGEKRRPYISHLLWEMRKKAKNC